MAEGLNRVMAIGNLGADAELKTTNGGQAVLKFSLACSESYVEKNSNERKERTEWIKCTIWGKHGESLAKHLVKGTKLYVEGALRTTSSEKNGEKRYFTEVNVSKVVFAGGKSDSQGGEQRQFGSGGNPRYGGGGGGGGRKAPDPHAPGGHEDNAFGGGFDNDDEIPFVHSYMKDRML